MAAIRQQIADLPSYGYRHACARVNRQRSAQGAARVNPKRAYRVMGEAQLLLPKAPCRRQSSRVHDGKMAVAQSDGRWCSDGLEIQCDSGQTVAATFTKDCCDREVLAWRAREGKGLPGTPVRGMLIESVERRFGAVEAIPADQRLEFLTDNGGAYIAADTRVVARSLGLTPVNAPVCSPQSNGMAESFVNPFKRDDVARMNLKDAASVTAQLPAPFEHFNEVHPPASLNRRSPREFRRHQAAQARSGSISDPALHCEQGRSGTTGARPKLPRAYRTRRVMRFVVVGATGRTGRQVTKQALARGHTVTAIVRNSSLDGESDVRVVAADPCKVEQMMPAFAGQDAVISCLGQRPGGNPWLVRDAAMATLQAMQQTGLKRLVVVSGALLYPSRNPLALFLKKLMADKLMDGRAAEDAIISSDTSWTLVRPPRLLEGNDKKGYRIATGARPRLTWSLQFVDLADCLLDLCEQGTCTREIVGVASL